MSNQQDYWYLSQQQTLNNLQGQFTVRQGYQSPQYWHIYNEEKSILQEVEKCFPDSALAVMLTSPIKEARTWAEKIFKQRKLKKLMMKLKETLTEEEYKLLEEKLNGHVS